MANKAKTEEKQEPTRTEAIAITKGIHTTPRKVRLVVDTIRGKTLADAYGILANLNKSSVSVVLKTVKSAEANATNNYHMDAEKLFIAKIFVGDGGRLKRFEPRAKGSSSPIIKRFSMLTVILMQKGAE